MRTYALLASIVLGFLSIQPAWAAPQHGGSQHLAPQREGGIAPMMPNPVVPQFNDPGPQFSPAQPGNPVQQLSPLGNSAQPDSLGIQ
jgi:hypothetical protein